MEKDNKKDPTIKYITYGMGFYSNGVIEIHKDLLLDPELHHAILKHELQHHHATSRVQHLLIDLFDMLSVRKTIKVIKFIVVRPRVLFNSVSPFIYDGKRFYINYSSLIINISFLFVILCSIYI